jgi:hypothetical protein
MVRRLVPTTFLIFVLACVSQRPESIELSGVSEIGNPGKNQPKTTLGQNLVFQMNPNRLDSVRIQLIVPSKKSCQLFDLGPGLGGVYLDSHQRIYYKQGDELSMGIYGGANPFEIGKEQSIVVVLYPQELWIGVKKTQIQFSLKTIVNDLSQLKKISCLELKE